MFTKKAIKKEAIELGIILGVMAVLYFTGLHTEVIGGLKRWVLIETGLIKAETEPIEKGQNIASYNFKITDLEGEIVNFEDFKGKTVFLNIWATWCPSCVSEMPEIHDLYKSIESEKVVFVMLSTDKDKTKLRKYIEKKGFDFPVYSRIEQLPDAFGTQAIPATFVISPEGKIVFKKVGAASYNTKKFKDYLVGL